MENEYLDDMLDNMIVNDQKEFEDNLESDIDLGDIAEEEFENEIIDNQYQEDSESISFTPFLIDLKENEIIDLPEGFTEDDLTDMDSFREILNLNIESKVEEELESRLEGLSEKTKRLIEIELNGGDTSELFENQDLFIDFDQVDVEDEDTQKQLITDLYSKKGFSESKINKLISNFESSGELEEEAYDAIEELKQIQALEIEEYNESIINKKEQTEELNNQAFDEIVYTVSNIQEIEGIKITPERRSSLINYITKPIVEDENGVLYTQYEIDTYSVEDKIKNAFFVQNKLTNFEKVKNDLTTKNTERMIDQLNKSRSKTAIKQDRNFGIDNLPTIEARDTL